MCHLLACSTRSNQNEALFCEPFLPIAVFACLCHLWDFPSCWSSMNRTWGSFIPCKNAGPSSCCACSALMGNYCMSAKLMLYLSQMLRLIRLKQEVIGSFLVSHWQIFFGVVPSHHKILPVNVRWAHLCPCHLFNSRIVPSKLILGCRSAVSILIVHHFHLRCHSTFFHCLIVVHEISTCISLLSY